MRLLVPALVACCWIALAGAPPAHAARAEARMEIDAKTTTFDGHAHTYVAKGNVRIRLPRLVVTCREATVYADAADAKILKVIFSGGVEATKGSDTFRAERITYFVADRRLVAEGTTHTRLKLPPGASGGPVGP